MANSAEQSTSQPQKKKKRVYLYEVDLMRVIFIFGVLANHATSAVTTPMTAESAPWYIMLGTHLILHFTRMGFMFVSGLVLFLGHYNKNRNWPQFWYKRYKGSGIPYLFWNGVFILGTAWVTGAAMTPGTWFYQWIDAILHANQFYMYYLLVMFQLYLIFPILVWFFHKLGSLRNHMILLVLSGTVQLAFLFWTKYVFPNVSHAGWPYMFANYGNFIGSYQFYFIAGAFTAIHYKTVVAFLQSHAKWIYSITAVLAVGTFGLFYFNMFVLKLSRHYVELIHQPYLGVYSSFMVVTTFMLSLEYAKRRTRPSWQWFSSFVSLSSKISFGVYLLQTVALTALAGILDVLNLSDWELIAAIPFAYIFALGSTWLLSYFCYKVPPFGILIGRPNFSFKQTYRKLFGKEATAND